MRRVCVLRTPIRGRLQQVLKYSTTRSTETRKCIHIILHHFFFYVLCYIFPSAEHISIYLLRTASTVIPYITLLILSFLHQLSSPQLQLLCSKVFDHSFPVVAHCRRSPFSNYFPLLLCESLSREVHWTLSLRTTLNHFEELHEEMYPIESNRHWLTSTYIIKLVLWYKFWPHTDKNAFGIPSLHRLYHSLFTHSYCSSAPCPSSFMRYPAV